jgi:hypothetical protein
MYDREKYLKRYHEIEKDNFTVYILKIEGKNIFKVGKTNRLKYRLINLRQALYENVDIFSLIPCENSSSAILLERKIQHLLKEFRIRREWFECPNNKIEEILAEFIKNE